MTIDVNMQDVDYGERKTANYLDIGILPSVSLSQKPQNAPMRFPVPDKFISWEQEFGKYEPTLILPTVDSARNAQEKSIERGFSKSYEGEYELNEDGIPKNIIGRTGFKGAGNLFNYGPNHASDMLLFTGPNRDGLFKAILITRADGSLAIPGGFIDVNETSESAAVRELSEEALKLSEIDCKRLEEKVALTYQGYVDDPRNTDNAWIETSFFSAHVSEAEFETYANRIKSENTDDAIDVNVVTLTSEVLDNLYASHGMMIRLAIQDKQKVENLSLALESKVISSLSELPLANAKKIGLLGGSFDPVHIGHLDVAENALKAHGLDCVVFIPAAQNPLKENSPMFSDKERINRINKLIAGYNNLFILDYEINKQDKSYTVDTLTALNKQIDETQSLHFVIGGDSLEALHTWREIEKCMSLAEFIVVRREDLTRERVSKLIENFTENIQEKLFRNFVSAITTNVSSTYIRDELAKKTVIDDRKGAP